MAEARVVSLADRLKQRREELGLSQAQAARELDVARTAYRLWEMEAAKPQPDRWRLISRWLGVSVTTMLLADELDEADRSAANRVSEAFERVGREWDEVSDPAEFFARASNLIQEGTEQGFLTPEHAEELLSVFARIQEERLAMASSEWEPARLAKQLNATIGAPKTARNTVAFLAEGVPEDVLDAARLLVSELVSNSVVHAGPSPADTTVGLLIDVNRERLRVEVSDTAPGQPQLTTPSEAGGYGLSFVQEFASRWHTTRANGRNHTWFELDLPAPGAPPQRR